VSLTSIVKSLVEQANENEDRAYRILGARPGPGVDVLIQPSEVVLDGRWKAEGLTKAGRNFVARWWFEQPLSNQKVAEMRKQLIDWNLSWRTLVPIQPLED
jgi:hypothetical protein